MRSEETGRVLHVSRGTDWEVWRAVWVEGLDQGLRSARWLLSWPQQQKVSKDWKSGT